MQSENLYIRLIERILSKIQGTSEEPNIKLKSLSSFANNVYKVTVQHDDHEQIRNKVFLFKRYREYLAEFSNKSIENQVVTTLSNHGCHPHVFYATKDYRIEQFVKGHAPGTQNVTEKQMLEIISRLADLVKIFKNFAQQKPEQFQNQRKITPMFIIFEKVAEQCQKLFPDSYQICKVYTQAILEEKIRKNLEKIVSKELVPTHNDCHFHNVIISDKDQTLYLIDYQFFSPNYRGFELGNFFNQYATDYHTFQIKQELELPEKTKQLLIESYYKGIESNLSKQQARQEVEVGRLLSHLFWLFIGVKQVKDPKITIDMQYYIKRRYEEFMKIYKRYVEEAEH